MPKVERWQDMTEDELIADLEQARREEAIRLGIDPAEHVKKMWDSFRIASKIVPSGAENAKS